MAITQTSTFHDQDEKRYVMDVNGQKAFIEYMIHSNKPEIVYLVHTEVPKALEGQGIGEQLVQETLQLLEDDQKRVAPFCPFIMTYFKRHPELRHLLTPLYENKIYGKD
jgi:hypothetical protein